MTFNTSVSEKMIYLLFLFILTLNNYCSSLDTGEPTISESLNNETHIFLRMFNRYIKCTELQRYNLFMGYQQEACDDVCKGLNDESYHGECISEYCVCIRDKLSNFILDDTEISTQNLLPKTEKPLYTSKKQLL